MQIALEQLPINERLSIINALWDSILVDNSQENMVLTQEQKNFIDERLEKFHKEGQRKQPAQKVLDDIRQQFTQIPVQT